MSTKIPKEEQRGFSGFDVGVALLTLVRLGVV